MKFFPLLAFVLAAMPASAATSEPFSLLGISAGKGVSGLSMPMQVLISLTLLTLLPAAVMSIGAANTFTRNIWKPFIHPQMSSREEAILAKLASLAVKVGALAVIFFMPTRFALDLQLLGGVWMVQIFPAMIFGLYTRWFSGTALLIGWAAGMVVGTALSWGEKAWTPVHPLAWDLPFVGHVDLGLHFAAYNGLTAVVVNIVVATALSLVIRTKAADETAAADYEDSAVAA